MSKNWGGGAKNQMFLVMHAHPQIKNKQTNTINYQMDR